LSKILSGRTAAGKGLEFFACPVLGSVEQGLSERDYIALVFS